jgi:crossover junction endodeoxyribonuclease RuvC
MVMRLLRLKSAPQPSDAADGVAAALTYALMPNLPKIEAIRFPSSTMTRAPADLKRVER